jgi:hypothetical protein
VIGTRTEAERQELSGDGHQLSTNHVSPRILDRSRAWKTRENGLSLNAWLAANHLRACLAFLIRYK